MCSQGNSAKGINVLGLEAALLTARSVQVLLGNSSMVSMGDGTVQSHPYPANRTAFPIWYYISNACSEEM